MTVLAVAIPRLCLRLRALFICVSGFAKRHECKYTQRHSLTFTRYLAGVCF